VLREGECGLGCGRLRSGFCGLGEGPVKEERARRRDLGVVCLVRLWIWGRREGRRVCRRWVRRVAVVVELVKRRVPWVGTEGGDGAVGWGEVDAGEGEVVEEEVESSESEEEAEEDVGSSSLEELTSLLLSVWRFDRRFGMASWLLLGKIWGSCTPRSRISMRYSGLSPASSTGTAISVSVSGSVKLVSSAPASCIDECTSSCPLDSSTTILGFDSFSAASFPTSLVMVALSKIFRICLFLSMRKVWFSQICVLSSGGRCSSSGITVSTHC